jgi:hypothetical protein
MGPKGHNKSNCPEMLKSKLARSAEKMVTMKIDAHRSRVRHAAVETHRPPTHFECPEHITPRVTRKATIARAAQTINVTHAASEHLLSNCPFVNCVDVSLAPHWHNHTVLHGATRTFHTFLELKQPRNMRTVVPPVQTAFGTLLSRSARAAGYRLQPGVL